MRKFTFRGKQPLLFVFVIFVTDHGAEIMVFSERLLIIGIKLRRMTKCIAARLFEFGRRRFGDVFRAYGRGIAGAEIRHLLLEVLFLRIREVRGEHSRDGETLERCQVELELSRHLVTVHVDRTAVHQGCIFIAALFPFRIAARRSMSQRKWPEYSASGPTAKYGGSPCPFCAGKCRPTPSSI